ncbi:hypothetical protein HK100_002049 [Physocladia obscura]|uniref:Uncharacterized protein n=1 Tax=Physocladia obscura TaxID=109957 RepID=A0AAD5SWV7_9FUNG|nr:hypothetical protein HK100_002049 [Physocladia obscura]
MSGKRQADRYITDQNFNEDDDLVEPTGEFKRADEQVMKNRTVAVPRRKATPAGTPSAKPAFANFTFGAPSTPLPVASSTPSKPKNFHPNTDGTEHPATENKPTAFVGFSFPSVSTSTPAPAAVTTTPSSFNKTAANTTGFSSLAQTGFTFPTSTTPKPVAATSASTNSSEISKLARKIRGLNIEFQEKISLAVEKNAFVDLTHHAKKYCDFYARTLAEHPDSVNCLKEKQNNVEVPQPLFSGSITPTVAVNEWTCATCLSMNSGEKKKCAACEADKPGSKPVVLGSTAGFSFNNIQSSKNGLSILGAFSSKLAPTITSSDVSSIPAPNSEAPKNWTCDSCLLANTGDKQKCAACENPREGVKPAVSVSLFNSTSKPDATTANWTCDSCLLSNTSEKEVCPACENPKSGIKSDAPKSLFASSNSSSQPAPVISGFSFSGALSSTSGFSFGASALSSKPNVSVGTASTDPTSTGFTFGAPAAQDNEKSNSDSSGTGSGFNFGALASSNLGYSFGNSSGVSSSPSTSTGYNFVASVPKENEQSSSNLSEGTGTVSGFSFGAPSSSKQGFSFGTNSVTASNGLAPGGITFGASTPVENEKSATDASEDTETAPKTAFTFGASTAGEFSFTKPPTAKPSVTFADIPTTSETAALNGFSFTNMNSPKTTTSTSPIKSSTGTIITPLASGISFGALATPARLAPTLSGSNAGFSFGKPPTNPSLFAGFGKPATTGVPVFGGAFSVPAAVSKDNGSAEAAGDDDDAPPDEQIDTTKLMRGAGEESEETLFEFSTRAFVFSNKTWTLLGKGIIKLNRDTTSRKSRLIVRADGSGRVLLNLGVFEGMGCKIEQGKAVTFMGIAEVGAGLQKYLCRLKNAEAAEKFCDEIGKALQK